jgi:hypothetical protein
MKKTLFLMAILPMMLFTACSSDSDDTPSIPVTQSAIIGEWSTGINDIHKYLEFESDGTGFYALFNGATMGQNYTFSYSISDEKINIKIIYSETKGLIGTSKSWNCAISGDKLKIDNETENGIYKKIKE